MKKIFMPLMALTLSFAVACNSEQKTDSTEVAEEKNEQKADSSNMGDKMEDDHEFMVEAASGGLMEVQLGTLASQNAASAKVKQFGQTMVKDHTKANEELKALAAKKNITIPPTPGSDHQKHIDELKAKKGAEFDKDYMSMMVKDHEEDVRNFEEAANNAKDPEIKAFAAKTLPTLKQHHQMAETIHNGLK
ncbi:DUF4142 domain-containing protein [Segetibacter sp. 3557_3]|uniref:DUF4142 domain-containing protein n=1 Tax=Segetibacter sp. 3557_3 TaxID=2547429 RepID=UPI0010591828|nr:DUF4142 domain-containing protein [Segetibacter sp. 3557_3]TDH19971.1 DUF4142 domain-containing protein [Segetibacter sp. 3557_3]